MAGVTVKAGELRALVSVACACERLCKCDSSKFVCKRRRRSLKRAWSEPTLQGNRACKAVTGRGEEASRQSACVTHSGSTGRLAVVGEGRWR